jgi:hypothetical protein
MHSRVSLFLDLIDRRCLVPLGTEAAHLATVNPAPLARASLALRFLPGPFFVPSLTFLHGLIGGVI